MGKLDKEQEARMAGMSYGVRIAREKGIDEAEKELKLRGVLGVGLLIDNTRLDKAFEIAREKILFARHDEDLIVIIMVLFVEMFLLIGR